MPSIALLIWQGERATRLNDWFGFHADTLAAGGKPSVTTRLEQGAASFLVAEFQGFCKELHEEAAAQLAAILAPHSHWGRQAIRLAAITGRKLDQSNPSPSVLGHDFSMFDISLWDALEDRHPKRKPEWHEALKTLIWARNGINHDDPAQLRKAAAVGWAVEPRNLERWRAALDELAGAMDHVVGENLHANLGVRPW